jgi:hypothetical protein
MAKEFIISSFFLILGLGIFIYNDSDLPQKQGPKHSQGKVNGMDVIKGSIEEINSGKQAKIETKNQEKTYSRSSMFQELEISPKIRKAIESSFSHPLSNDVVANSAYEDAIQVLNDDPEGGLKEISGILKTIGPESDATRNHLLNLALQIEGNESLKGRFISDYLTSSKFEVTKHGLADNSMSLSTAIDYLGRVFPNEEEAQVVISEILSIENEQVKHEVIERLKIYYPTYQF